MKTLSRRIIQREYPMDAIARQEEGPAEGEEEEKKNEG